MLRFTELFKWINKVPTGDLESRARSVMSKAQIGVTTAGDFENKFGREDYYVALGRVVLLYQSCKFDRET